MPTKSITAAERRELLDRYLVHYRKKYGDGPEPTLRQARQLLSRMAALRSEYAERLPRISLSCCPHCRQPLVRAFDPYGLDGFWWAVNCTVDFEEPPPCEHYCVLQGALDLHGRRPEEVTWELTKEVLPGPAVPFLIPRLLGLDEIKVVISSLRMTNGDTAYPIAYFAAEPPPSEELHQGWARRTYQVVDGDGEPRGWDSKLDVWDFDLEPWIAAGKVYWIDSDDESLTLKGSGPCPYANLPGERRPQHIKEGRLAIGELPEGGTIDPMD